MKWLGVTAMLAGGHRDGRGGGVKAGARALIVAASLAGAATSCTDANESLVIVQAQSPDIMCNLSEDTTGTARRLEGILDLGLDQAYGYNLYPLVANNLQPLAMNGGIEPNRISIDGAEVKVIPPAGLDITWPQGCDATFDESSSASVMPGERKVISISAMRSCHAAVIRDLFLAGKLNPALTEKIKFTARIRAHGRHGGTDIYSDPFMFPIRTCYGCLQTGFTGPYAEFSFAVSPPKILACDHLAENPYRGNPCNPAQDIGPILCCAQDAKGEKLLCPGIPQAKAAAPAAP